VSEDAGLRERCIEAGRDAMGRNDGWRWWHPRHLAKLFDVWEPMIREESDMDWEYEIVYDGDPYMGGGYERRVAGRLKTLEEAKRGFDIVNMRAPHSGDKPNLRIERRLVGPWEVVNDEA
jgi:hypothetical protein